MKKDIELKETLDLEKNSLLKNNRLKIYEHEVAPLVNALKMKCKELNMPMFVTVCPYTPNAKSDKALFESEYTESINEMACTIASQIVPNTVNNMVSPYSCGVSIKPDLIAECIKLLNGFHAEPNSDTFDVEDMAVGNDFIFEEDEIDMINSNTYIQDMED